jgi:hypothetical protein
MNFKRLLDTPTGHIFISILLGLGLATLFKKTCADDKCLVFNGPVIEDIKDKTFKHGEKCYKYTSEPGKCDSTKRIIDVSGHDTIVK